MKAKKERIHLIVAVDIWHESEDERHYAIAMAKENVLAASNVGVAEPVEVTMKRKARK